MVQNKGLIFKKVPDGAPKVGQDLVVETRDFDKDAAPPPGGITVQNLYVSYDPYQRGRMRAPEVKSYHPPFTLDQPISNSGVARVLKSDYPNYKTGDLIIAHVGFEEYTALSKEVLERASHRKLENPHGLDVSVHLGALGMPGLTAYSSLYEIGKPKKGETIFISSAAGAVGVLVGQLAKHEGLTVIGSVGDDEKLKFIKECGFDDGFNYKKEKAPAALERLCPKGIDIYYENVGGEQLQAALDAMNFFGRIVACGMISQYSLKPDERYGVTNLMSVVGKRLTIRGFIVSDQDFGPRWTKEHQEKVGKWLADGTFKEKRHVTDGIDQAGEGFVGMLEGKNFGKAILKIADP